jgi:hypothetical protein
MNAGTIQTMPQAAFALQFTALATLAGVQMMPQWSCSEIVYVNPILIQTPLLPLIQFEDEPPRDRFIARLPAVLQKEVEEGDTASEAGARFRSAWQRLQGLVDEMKERASSGSGTKSTEPGGKRISLPESAPSKEVCALAVGAHLGSAIALAAELRGFKHAVVADRVCQAARCLYTIKDFEGSAMLAEAAASLFERCNQRPIISLGEDYEAASTYRTLAARSYLESFKASRDGDLMDRLRLDRGIWNVWQVISELDLSLELLKHSASYYLERSMPFEAVADMLRGIWHLLGKDVTGNEWKWIGTTLAHAAKQWEKEGLDTCLPAKAIALSAVAIANSKRR